MAAINKVLPESWKFIIKKNMKMLSKFICAYKNTKEIHERTKVENTIKL